MRDDDSFRLIEQEFGDSLVGWACAAIVLAWLLSTLFQKVTG